MDPTIIKFFFSSTMMIYKNERFCRIKSPKIARTTGFLDVHVPNNNILLKYLEKQQQ